MTFRSSIELAGEVVSLILVGSSLAAIVLTFMLLTGSIP